MTCRFFYLSLYYKKYNMTEEEIKSIFRELLAKRNWYSGTSLNRAQAWEMKRRFNIGELSTGRILEVLMECGYDVEVKKGKEK